MKKSKFTNLLPNIIGERGDLVKRNTTIHNKIAQNYDEVHGEIFNSVEQRRIRETLTIVVNMLDRNPGECSALDFGAGTGNLTNHLLKLGLDVTAADVSKECLEVVKSRYNCKTILLENGSTSLLKSNAYDLVCLYSVLHHVPDYLALLDELNRICKPGGIIYIDHENSPIYWERLDEFKKIYKKLSKFNMAKYMRLSNYVHKVKSLFIHRYTNEGDIHVWPDDHIDWSKIDLRFERLEYGIILEREFLLHKGNYIESEYSKVRDNYFDTRCVAYKSRI